MILAIVLFTLMTAGSADPIAAEPAAFKSVGCDFFGPDNAAKLLGPRFRGEDGGMTDDSDGKSWRCTFMRTQNTDEKSPRIHFMLTKAPSTDAAISVFNAVRTSNSKKMGWQEWTEVGDEAIIHADSPNFQLIMIRNGARTIRIKINPATGVSLEDSKGIAMSLAAKLAKQ